MRAAQVHVARERLRAGPLLSSDAALNDYLAVTLRDRRREAARMLYLNAANRLLRDEGCAEGSPLEVVIHPREVIRRALELGATALILVHNHPSGDPTPSRADLEATRRLAAAAAPLDITLHDHVIVAAGGCASFRALGLL